jgi:integrase
MPLTNAEVKSAKPAEKPYKLADQHGLFLLVKPSGSKLWQYKYRIAGKEGLFSIGQYPDISLADARDSHAKARALVREGTHPKHQRELEDLEKTKSAINTFRAIANDWMSVKKKSWSASYSRQVEHNLKSDVYPKIGALPIRQVTSAHILEIVKAVEARGAESIAILIRQWCSQIFCYAISHLQADYDVAAAIKGAITKPKVEHHKPISESELPRFIEKLRTYGGQRATVIAIELLLLTYVRTGELRMAKWSEFDLQNSIWRVPAERMKMKQEHIVPLAKQAVALLAELREINKDCSLLFPNQRNLERPITATTINRALENMGYGGQISGHCFRSTASTILYELGYRTEVIERQLAHAESNKVKAAYNQAQYLKERAEMMQAYADRIDNLVLAYNAEKNSA